MTNSLKSFLKNTTVTLLYLVPVVPFLIWGELFFPYITTKAFAWRIIVELGFFTWIVLAVADEAYRPKKSPLLYALGAFILVVGLADIFGQAPVKSFWSNFERMEGFVGLLHLGAFFLVISNVFDEKNWVRWWNISLAASGIMALIGLSEVAKGGWRIDATFGNASYMAVYMLFHIFIALLMMWRKRNEKTFVWIYGVLAVILTIALYYTATRGAILGLIGGLFMLSVLNFKNNTSKRARKLSLGLLASVVVLVGGFFLIKNTAFVQNNDVLVRFANISTEELKGGGRSFVWPIALEGIKERPLLGWGQENFIYVFSEHYSPEMYRLEPWFDRAHNIFLDWAIAGGLIGLALYLSLYVLLIYTIWKKDAAMSKVEKSILTSLVFAYFIHNIFVFDHLISYILFFALLAYITYRNSTEVVWNRPINTKVVKVVSTLSLLIALIAIYTINIKPLSSNLSLIEALKKVQSGETAGQAPQYFKKAYEGAYLGRSEVAEQISANALTVLDSGITTEEKNRFFDFSSNALREQAEVHPKDPRYSLAAGSFFSRTGQFEIADLYLTKAQELIPGKQAVYFEQGVLLINQKKYKEAEVVLKEAYEMAPEFGEAQILYFVSAIYAGDKEAENNLSNNLNVNIAYDDRIAGAYLQTERYKEAIDIYSFRLANATEDPQAYISLAVVYLQSGQKDNAIEILNLLSKNIPGYKTQAEIYIEQIQNGEL